MKDVVIGTVAFVGVPWAITSNLYSLAINIASTPEQFCLLFTGLVIAAGLVAIGPRVVPQPNLLPNPLKMAN